MSDVGCRMSDVGCRMSDVGCRMSDVGCRQRLIQFLQHGMFLRHSSCALDRRLQVATSSRLHVNVKFHNA